MEVNPKLKKEYLTQNRYFLNSQIVVELIVNYELIKQQVNQ